MNTKIENLNKIVKGLLLDYPKLSEFESLSLAIQIQRNQLLENGLNISTTDKYPSALEAISIALGYTGERSRTITDILKDISDKEHDE